MQTIKIGSTDTLVFFDPVSNTHIVKGSLAAEEGLQCITAKPTALSVARKNEFRFSKQNTCI